MAQVAANPIAVRIQQSKQAKAQQAAGLQPYFINGSASYDPETKQQSFKICIVATDLYFEGAAEDVDAPQEPLSSPIVGELDCVEAPIPGTLQPFKLLATTDYFFVELLNDVHVPNKWLAANPVPGLAGVSCSGAGAWKLNPNPTQNDM